MHKDVYLWTNEHHTSRKFWLLNVSFHFNTLIILLEQLVEWLRKQCQGPSKSDLPGSRHLQYFHTTFVNSVEERYFIPIKENKPCFRNRSIKSSAELKLATPSRDKSRAVKENVHWNQAFFFETGKKEH